jgi:hypothetical protein
MALLIARSACLVWISARNLLNEILNEDTKAPQDGNEKKEHDRRKSLDRKKYTLASKFDRCEIKLQPHQPSLVTKHCCLGYWRVRPGKARPSAYLRIIKNMIRAAAADDRWMRIRTKEVHWARPAEPSDV